MRRILVLAVAMALMLALAPPASARGATQISGEGRFEGDPTSPGRCTDAVGPYNISIYITGGDIEGCLYQVWDGPFAMKPSGAYIERGTETFVSAANTNDRFATTYVFSGKFIDGPGPDGIPNTFDDDFSNELFGRCQHPIVPGSGTGAFEGVTGRLDFKDVIVRNSSGEIIDVFFPMRGHLK